MPHKVLLLLFQTEQFTGNQINQNHLSKQSNVISKNERGSAVECPPSLPSDLPSLLPEIHPRVSIAVSFAAVDNEETPFIARKYLPLPPFQLRIAILSSQRIRLYQSEPLREDAALFWDCFYQQIDLFDQQYARKVCRAPPVQSIIRKGGAEKYGNIKKIMPTFF